MLRKLRNHSIILAVLLQALPLCRPLITAPSALPTFAFIFRWVVWGGAALGTYDAVSGATTVYYTTPTNFTGVVGAYFTNYVAITNNGGDPGAFFVLTNKSGISPALANGVSTIVCMPPGLTFKCFDLNNGGSPKPVYGAIFGTPTSPVTNHWVHVLAGYQGLTPAQTNIYFSFFTAVRPTITNQPAGLTNVAGAPASLSVLAGGTSSLSYQWRLHNTNNLPNATNSMYSIANLHLSDTGDYTVLISNSAGSITSSVAHVEVTLPALPQITFSPPSNGIFSFNFVPVAGLTNSVLTNGDVAGPGWAPLTNIPPPASASPITVQDPISGGARYYRVMLRP